MKPVKPKKIPRDLERWLNAVLREDAKAGDFSEGDARSVLAALEYERQRADKAQPMTKEAFLKAAEKVAYSPEYQREQTAAVVPKPKAKRTPCDSCGNGPRGAGLSVCESCAKRLYGRGRG